MRKTTLTLLFLFFISSTAQCQRILEIVSPPMTNLFTEIAQDDFVYFSERGGLTLQRYDGTTWTAFDYPVRDDIQLEFQDYSENLFVFGANVYVVLVKGGTSVKYLYQFNGASFSPLAFPGNVVSNAVIFRGKIHVLIETTLGVKLFSYNGSVVSEVPSSLMTTTQSYSLRGGGRYLYIRGNGGYSTLPDYLKRYDGSTFRNLPAVHGSVHELNQTFQIFGSEKVYLVFDDRAIYYYDGISMTEIYRVDGVPVYSPLLWRGDLYFEAGAGTHPVTLYKCIEGSRSEITVPGATLVRIYRFALYRDNLYLPVQNSSGYFIYSYDGTAFTSFLSLPGVAGEGTSIEVRQGNLVILPRVGSDSSAYEYSGTGFTEIQVPGDEWLFEIQESARCYHAWMIGYFDRDDYEYKFVLAVERPDASCPPLDESETTVIPTRLQVYERIVISPYGRERDWCWTGIEVDWEIIPTCPFPCTDPKIISTMKDKNGKISWQKTFSEPFNASISLTDTQPYTLSLGVETNQIVEDVLVFNNDLVNKGFESFKLDMYPKQDYFYLTVTTDKDIEVPFTMTLRNMQGQSLWQEKYTAPMDELIRAYVPKAGDYLQFSLQPNPTSSVTYYPNPTEGKLTISVSDDNQSVWVSVSDFNGKVISRKDNIGSGEHTLDISNQKPGLYILTIVEGKSTRRELIGVK